MVAGIDDSLKKSLQVEQQGKRAGRRWGDASPLSSRPGVKSRKAIEEEGMGKVLESQ